MTAQAETVSNRHDELFHYTTVVAFENIHKSRSLWATSYEHMTDSSELARFRLKVSEFIRPKIAELVDKGMQINARGTKELQEQGDVETLIGREAAMHLDTMHQKTFGERGLQGAYIASFCTPNSEYESQNGLLSQWRGYGTDGGVAIVFDTKGLESLMREESEVFAHPVNHIGDVTYDNDPALKEKPEFRGVFDHFPDILRQFYSGTPPTYERIFVDFVMGSTLVKHLAFSEEREVRIVVSPGPLEPSIFFDAKKTNRKTIKYRVKDARESKYIELFGNAALPIKRVIVGPSRIQNVNYQTIKTLAVGSRIEVRKSETPFLG